MLLQTLHVEIELKNLNLQLMLLMLKGVEIQIPRVVAPLP